MDHNGMGMGLAMWVLWILVFIILVLLIIWILKQINRKR